MRWRRRRRRRACGGARRTNKQTKNTRTRGRARAHPPTQPPTHARDNNSSTEKSTRTRVNTRQITWRTKPTAPEGASKWTKQQRLDEARRAHAKTEKGSSYEQGDMSICATFYCARRWISQDTLAEWLRRRPAKPMGSPCVGSNPTGVVVAFVRSLRRRVAGQRAGVRVSARVVLW